MSFNITLYQNSAEKNKVDKTNYLTQIAEYTGELKAETSIIDPVILIECDLEDVALSNYMYIPEFERYYYVTNITSVRSSLVQFEAHCDVLMSFKTEILTNEAIIKRQTSEFNLYQNDNKIGFREPPIVQVKKFPAGFEGWSYVLYIAGGGSGVAGTTWILECLYASTYDTDDAGIGAGSTGIRFIAGDYRYIIGTKGFISEFNGNDGLYTYKTNLQTAETETEYIGGTDLTPYVIQFPDSETVSMMRVGGKVITDLSGQVGLGIYSNSIDGEPDILERNNLASYYSGNWLDVDLPNDFNYLRFEYSKLVTPPTPQHTVEIDSQFSSTFTDVKFVLTDLDAGTTETITPTYQTNMWKASVGLSEHNYSIYCSGVNPANQQTSYATELRAYQGSSYISVSTNSNSPTQIDLSTRNLFIFPSSAQASQRDFYFIHNG